MKVNFNRKFKNFDGSEMEGETIATMVAKALFTYGNTDVVDGDTKFMAYMLCQKIAGAHGEADITVEEASLIKEVCGKSLIAGGYGQVCEIVEQAK